MHHSWSADIVYMSDTSIAEFPLDEVVRRARFVIDLLPEVGLGLTQFQDQSRIQASKSSGEDMSLMTKADKFVEQRLLGAISTNFPEDRIHSEEEGETGQDGDYQWWIDPVDGTRNFIHGVPLYCISVGLCFREQPVAGIVSVPALGEIYHAIHGSGAFKNEMPLQVSPMDSIERALVSSGLPYERVSILNSLVANIAAFVATGTGLRRTGSTVLDLCWIAEGRFDAMWERDVTPWDTAAASVIVREAGGRLSDFLGQPFNFKSPELVASNAVLHESVIETLTKARDVEGIN